MDPELQSDNQPSQPIAADTTPQVDTEPTLEDVYKTVEPAQEPREPQAPQAQPQYQPQPQASTIPDPYDTAAYQRYMQGMAQGQAQLQQGLLSVAQMVAQAQQKEQQAKAQADIQAAVEAVNEVVNHPKPKLIEAMLDAKAREDSRFKSLWENRAKNPQAWNNACKAFGREVAKDWDIKVDPKLQESQRVRKASQGAMPQSETPTSDNKWDGLNGNDFEREWQRAMNGNAT